MANQYIKAVLKSNVMDHLGNESACSVTSGCSNSNSSNEEDYDTDSSHNTMGLRSPGGPMRGRSVKEFEEQLAGLKKENFNLKLRIYFLEEKMGTNFTLDKDNVVKKNIELQVEIANLQKEVHEKQELLCQAMKAMDLEDEEHKKFVALKEEELQQYQQELEDLRNQLQETRLDSDGYSVKSDTTGFYSSKATNSGNFISELQEKIRMLETELQLEKENSASLQIILGQAETLKNRYETMQKEFQLKDEMIKDLGDEIEAANEKILGCTDQIKDLESKLNSSIKENQMMQKKLQVENKKFEEVMCQLTDLKKKFTMAKGDLEREHKRAERVKMMTDMRMSELEDENEKQKMKIRDLQGKLEAALIEIKKNQNLAVSKSLVQKSNSSNTDDNSFSVSNPTTPAGTPKKNSLHVQVDVQKINLPTSPLSPEKFNIQNFEQLLCSAGEPAVNDKILSQFQTLLKENADMKQKIVKLKSEQMKACEIIKNMIESSTKSTEENCLLKKRVEELERELELVVSKPTKDGNETPLQQRVANMNIKAANPVNEKSMEDSQFEDLEIAEHYKALTVELEAKIEILVATLNEKDAQMQKIRQQYDEILTSLEDKENRIVDLEFELLTSQKDRPNSDRSVLEKGDSGSEKHSSFYRHEIEEKDKEIEKLSVELKKCTCYLQEIVNTELWEKNKEIEKLHNKQANSSEVLKLRKELSEKEVQLKLLKEKISELGLDVNLPSEDLSYGKDLLSSPSKNIQHIKALQEHLKLCKDERNYFKDKYEELNIKMVMVDKLQVHNENLKSEIEKCEKLRRESNEVCSVLSSRLEELAIFLDSLLKQKSILGFLGSQKNRRLREIIDSSLDLSRSFTMSLMINPDQSLAQLSNITTLLNGSVLGDLTLDPLPQAEDDSQAVLSIIPDNVTLTYQSHLYKQCKSSEPNNEQVILALRQQVINLKSELQLRDNELNKINVLHKEVSEKTTETDEDETYTNKVCTGFKDVSKLFTTPTNKCNTTSTTLKYQSDCQSESEAWSEPDRVISRARIGLSRTFPITFRQTKEDISESTEEELASSCTPTKRNWNDKRQVVELQQRICELEEKLKCQSVDLFNAQTKMLESNEVYKSNIEDLERKFTETERNLLKAQTQRDEAENQINNLQQTIEELTKSKQLLEESMVVKDKEMQNRINQLEVDKEEAYKVAQMYEKEVADAKNAIEAAETKLREMYEEMNQLEGNLRTEYEQFTIIKLKDAEEQFTKKFKDMEEKAEKNLIHIREEYSKDFIKKSEVEKKLIQVEKLGNELDEVKNIVKSYEETIECYKEKENEIRHKTHEYQDKINSLRKDLDNTTLQYSEAVLEKTKLANEKTQLEQELSKFNMKETEMKQQFHDIQTEFVSVNEHYQQQMSTLQKQKSKLEMKISELESTNAELHNKLVRMQAGYGDFNITVPIVGNKNVQMVSFKRQYSDQNYSSEENISFNRPLIQDPRPVDMERHEANSSPDLGIESDHGRFSSLETPANIPRPLLQTIELTESMSNLLDGENNQGDTCGNEHCCQKTLDIIRENGELKKKLLRMKRALEETANQLNLANQRKRQVEKTIYKQIHKTSEVLRKAKANLDSGSESDVLNKT